MVDPSMAPRAAPNSVATPVAIPCPGCAATDMRPVAEVTRYATPFRMARCRACGLLHMNPRPPDVALDQLYDADYYAGEADFSYSDDRRHEPQVRAKAAGRLARVERMLDRDGIATRRVVELGCSWGTFLDEARLRGWEPQGCEISPESGTWAHAERQLTIHACDLADAPLADESVDLVTASEVVEHLTAPRRTLSAALRILRPGGVVVFSTANESSVARLVRGANWGYYMPGHVVVWSVRSLGNLLRELGFVDVDVHAGDERGLANFRAFQRAGGPGSVPAWFVKRLRLGWWTLGAGMVVTARKPGSAR